MELDYALLAEKAARLSDNRLVVFGGDVDSIESPLCPAIFQCSLAARLLLKPDEPLEGHAFSIEITSVAGERKQISEPQKLNTTRNEKYPNLAAGAALIIGMTIVFGKPGIHYLHLMVDGREVKSWPLAVNIPDEPTIPPLQEEKK